MERRPSPLFTPTEAAVLSGLPLKAVHNAIDRHLVKAVSGRRAGHARRLLDVHGLMSLTLERRLADRLAPNLRREIFETLALTRRTWISVDDGLLIVDLRPSRRALAASLWALRRARSLIVSDSRVMGGEPVFRGTRVPVETITALLANGMDETSILESYPTLTAEMVRLAPLHSAAYPGRGRPRTQPWHDCKPVLTTKRKLTTLAAE
jgi:uncharacterized protein (DUF433 family)